MDNLPRLIKENYGPVIKFSTDVLEMGYGTFNYKLRNKTFNYLEIKKILDTLGIVFEDLDDAWERVHKSAERLYAKSKITMDQVSQAKQMRKPEEALEFLRKAAGKEVSESAQVIINPAQDSNKKKLNKEIEKGLLKTPGKIKVTTVNDFLTPEQRKESDDIWIGKKNDLRIDEIGLSGEKISIPLFNDLPISNDNKDKTWNGKPLMTDKAVLNKRKPIEPEPDFFPGQVVQGSVSNTLRSINEPDEEYKNEED